MPARPWTRLWIGDVEVVPAPYACKCGAPVDLPDAYYEGDNFLRILYHTHKSCGTRAVVLKGKLVRFDTDESSAPPPGLCAICEEQHPLALIDSGVEDGRPWADYFCEYTGKTFTRMLRSQVPAQESAAQTSSASQ